MKNSRLLTTLVILFLFSSNQLSAQSSQIKNHKVTVAGTSSLHGWESVIEKLDCTTHYKVEHGKLLKIQDAEMKFFVESIKSTEGKVMDNKTYDAFNSDKFPWIVFNLKSENIRTRNSTVSLKGSLSMAGTTNPIELVATYKVLPNGDLQLTGSKKIKMTEFNMKPPKAMLGMITVGDEVTISFDITLSNTGIVL